MLLGYNFNCTVLQRNALIWLVVAAMLPKCWQCHIGVCNPRHKKQPNCTIVQKKVQLGLLSSKSVDTRSKVWK